MRLVLAAVAVLLLVFVVPMVWHTLSPFIIAIPVAAMLQPLIGFFEKRLHVNRGFAVLFWVFLVSAVAICLLYWFTSFAIEQLVSAASNAPSLVGSITSMVRTAIANVLGAAETLPETVSVAINDSINSALKWFTDNVTSMAGSLLNGLVGFASSIPYALIYANFLILGVFFISARYPELKAQLVSRRKYDESENFGMLRRTAGKGALGYIRVQMMWFFILLTLATVFFQSFGFQYAVLIALLAALLEMIPQFGCGVLYVPWAIICFLVGQHREAWLILGFYVAYSMLRRILDPKLLGDNLGMSPLLSLVGMFVGMRLGGVIGLILGPIAMVVLVSAVRSHLFDGIAADLHTLVSYLKRRWHRGLEEEPMNAEK